MKLYFVFVLLVAICLFESALCQNKTTMTFKEFKVYFHKTYKSEAEEKLRQQIFQANMKAIIQKKGCTACGVTQFSDLTQEEFEDKLLNLVTLQNVVLDAEPEIHYSNVTFAEPQDQILSSPDTFDWRQHNVLTPVKSQGQCGDCWSFSTTAVTQSFSVIKGLTSNNVDLSEQYLLQCTPGNACNGGTIQAAMDKVILGNGMPSQTDYPYNPYFTHSKICSAPRLVQSPMAFRISKYHVSDDELISLLQHGPVNGAIAANAFNTYNPSVNKVLSCQKDDQLNHAIVIVGYTNDYWIIRNSWGDTFGIQGYVYVNRDQTNGKNCKVGVAIHNFIDSCTIQNCVRCLPRVDSCQICSPGYYLQIATEKKGSDYLCKACLDSNCNKCYHTLYADRYVGICKFCNQGYSLNIDDSSCQVIPIKNCKFYWTSDLTGSLQYFCKQCLNDYIVSSDNQQCLVCNVQHCNYCAFGNANTCHICEDGYEGPNCEPNCVDHCSQGCTLSQICDQCDLGYSGQDCTTVSCSIRNCNAGCSVPNVCDSCNNSWTGQDCSSPTVQQVVSTNFDANSETAKRQSLNSYVTIILPIIVVFCLICAFVIYNSIRGKKDNQQSQQKEQNQDKKQHMESQKYINNEGIYHINY